VEAAVAFNAMPSLSTTYVGGQNGQNGNPNLNYIHPNSSSNPDTTYQQHREYARSSPSSQLPSLTSANPNGPALQNSVLQTPQNLVEFNNECLLVYNKYLIPNSEFARVHQRMNQELWQQEQLAREEAAKLKESVVTALAKAIAASSRPDLDHADPLPVPTTGGSPGGGSPAPISTKPGSAAASQPLNQPDPSYVPRRQPQEQMAKYNEAIEATMVPETPNSAPEANQNLALEPNTLALQARTLLGNQNSFPQTSKTWALVTAAQQQPQQPQQPGEGSPVVPQHQPGGLAAAQHQPGEGNLAAAKAIAANQNMVPQTNPNSVPQTNQNSVPQTSNTLAAQHQSIEGQGLSMPIIAIQNAISCSNSEPQNKFINTYHYIVLDNPLYYRVNNSKQSCNDSTNNANFLAEQKSTKNFQKRSKYSRQKFRKFRQISMSKNVIRMVLGRSRKKFSHKNIISNKIPKKLLKH
jgi:hypothetical protein